MLENHPSAEVPISNKKLTMQFYLKIKFMQKKKKKKHSKLSFSKILKKHFKNKHLCVQKIRIHFLG